MHDVEITALGQHRGQYRALKAVKDKKPVFAPAEVEEAQHPVADEPRGEKLCPDLVEHIRRIKLRERRAERGSVEHCLRLAVVAARAVGAEDHKAHQHKLRALCRRRKRIFHRVGRNIVVRIHEHHIIRVRAYRINAAVARHCRTGIRHAYDVGAPVVARGARGDLRRGVGRAVVHDDKLKLVMRLTEHAFHCALYILSGVVRRDYHGYLWLLHSTVLSAAGDRSEVFIHRRERCERARKD